MIKHLVKKTREKNKKYAKEVFSQTITCHLLCIAAQKRSIFSATST